ncbi:MAG: rod shape-determining protein RodA [bacterium]|nr:rod shape-determining protein RodA [bacterium]
MISAIFRFIRSADWLLLISVTILTAFGCAALYSIGLGKDPQNFLFLQKQSMFLGISVVVLFIVSVTNYRFFQSTSIALYIVSCLILGAVLIVGQTINGTKGWFSIAGFGIQPVELAKISLILVLARYFSRYTRQMRQMRHIVLTGMIAAFPITLIMLQPDFGSAAVLFAIWAGMIVMSGIPKKYVLSLGLIMVVLMGVAWFGLFKDYQKQRILSFLSPTAHQQGSGYNVRQAMIAIGEGQVFGKGLGQGSQSHLKFLPETQTDFIFSVLAEEVGLVGLGIIFMFWTLFFYRLSRIMLVCRDDFAIYSVLGIAIMFIVHVILNIGGNMGLVPLTGLVLPFMSYGGSALASGLVAVGIAQSVKIHNS